MREVADHATRGQAIHTGKRRLCVADLKCVAYFNITEESGLGFTCTLCNQPHHAVTVGHTTNNEATFFPQALVQNDAERFI